MTFVPRVLITIGLAALVSAIPALETQTIRLDNGTAIVPAGIIERSPELEGLVARDDYPNCKGSSRCTNSQGFKDQCSAAKNKIEKTTYTDGGTSSGVCSGSCGIFIQGKGCSISGDDLANGYDTIRAYGCQACGNAQENGSPGCLIKVNYVTGC